MQEILEVLTAKKIQRGPEYPGPSVEVDAVGMQGPQTVELYGVAGLISAPGAGTKVLFTPGVGGRSSGIAICGHNYKLQLEFVQGDTILYATDAAGATVMAKVHLTAAGIINIIANAAANITAGGALSLDGTALNLNGSARQFVTHAELNAALQTFVTALNAALATKKDEAGAAGALTLDITAARTDTVFTG